MRETAMRFETFFEENYEAVRRSLAVAFGDPVLAEELAQDAFTRALSGWRRVAQMERPAGWVYVVALRAGRRGRGSDRQPMTTLPISAPDIADDVTRDLALGASIAQLPERQRIALVLRYLADLPLADVAEAMDCAVGTVKSTVHAALERLGVELAEQEESDGAR